jgi:hypothetical protein
VRSGLAPSLGLISSLSVFGGKLGRTMIQNRMGRSSFASVVFYFSFLILHWLIAVGTVIADRPPHRPVRAELPHTVLTADVDVQTSRLHVHPAIRATWLRTVSRPPSGSVSGPVATVQVGPRKDKRNPRDLCARALSYFLYGRPRDKREPSGLTIPHTCPRERISDQLREHNASSS